MKYVNLEVDVTYRVAVTASITDEAYAELQEILSKHHGKIYPFGSEYVRAMDFLSSNIDDEEACDMRYHIRQMEDMDS